MNVPESQRLVLGMYAIQWPWLRHQPSYWFAVVVLFLFFHFPQSVFEYFVIYIFSHAVSPLTLCQQPLILLIYRGICNTYLNCFPLFLLVPFGHDGKYFSSVHIAEIIIKIVDLPCTPHFSCNSNIFLKWYSLE